MNEKTKRGMPLIGIGTWGIGGKHERDLSHRQEEVGLIEEALKIGFRLIDTAEVYGNGGAEEIIGEAIKSHKREDLFIVSKVYKNHLAYDAVLKSAENSLKRLGTGYLDCYLIHWPNDRVALEETIEAMRVLKDRNMIKSFGVSNFGVPLLLKAVKIAPNEIAVNQIEFNFLNRQADNEIIPFCFENNIDVMAYRPLARGGILNDKSILALSKNYSCTPSQYALAWLREKKVVAVPKAGSRVHLRENWQSQDVHLS